MKKLFLYTALVLGMALASCGKEETEPPAREEPKEEGAVTVTVTMPEGTLASAGSRAMPSAYPGHKLRCILIVEENGAVTIRQEKLADEAKDGSFFFDITPESEDFKCSFWADYIKEDAIATDGRYPDLYYNTESLPTVGYKLTGSELFHNDACDAFSLSLLPGATAGTMTRPMAKLSFTDERPATVAEAGSIAVSGYKVYTDFHIVNGTVGDTPATLSYSGAPADAENGVWFSNYLFVGHKNRLPGNFSMTAGANTHEVATDNVTLTANRPITASLNWQRANGIITVDVNFTDPDLPEVGMFLQKDGTFSRTYSAENSIGIVFASGAKGNDVPSNYGSQWAAGYKIVGYAMGLTSVSDGGRVHIGLDNSLPSDMVFADTDGSWEEDYYGGYTDTQKMLATIGDYASPLLGKTAGAFATWTAGHVLEDGSDVSGWYIPSARQVLDIMGMASGYAGDEERAAVEVNEALKAAIEASGNRPFGRASGATYIMSSSVTNGGRFNVILTATEGGESIGECQELRNNSQQYAIRPVLTLFAKE